MSHQTIDREKARLITELEIAVASTNDAEYMTDNDVRNQYEDKGEALRKRQEELKKQRYMVTISELVCNLLIISSQPWLLIILSSPYCILGWIKLVDI